MTDVKEKVGVLTDEISTAGRPIYKTSEGEMVSEKSTTFKYKGGWINIPTIHNGYSYDEEELRIMLDNNIIKPTSTHKNLKAAEKAAKERSPTLREFNKGGTAMKDQMEMSFALGGVAETVDPVSGNDVPPGSLPEEVRDDIPARLSEGEYVVPADVVRYYGVKFFEDLRTQAKTGLQQMDADGRIGGEPIEPQQAEMTDEQLNSIIEQAMQQEQPVMANEGVYVPPNYLGMSVFGDKGDKEGTPYEFYDPDVGGYKPTTGDYGTTTPEAPTVTANVPDPVCPPGPNGERQRYDKSKGMCVPVSEGPTTEPEDPKPSVPFGSDFNDGQGVNWTNSTDVLKFANTLNTGIISEDVRTGAGLATAFIPGAAPIAALGVLGSKIDSTKDIAGLKATRMIAAALGQDIDSVDKNTGKVIKENNVEVLTGMISDYEKKYGDGFSGTFGIGTGLNYAASALGVDRKDIKEFMEIYDSKASSVQKAKAKEKIQVLIQTSSNKEKERRRQERIRAEQEASAVAAREAARRATITQSQKTRSQKESDRDDSYQTRIERGYGTSYTGPGTGTLDTKRGKTNRAYGGRATGGLVQKRKKKK